MPSPFPGMDPWLENPDHWPGVHHELISGIRTALNRHIRPRYLATVQERVFVSDDSGDRAEILPDVSVRGDQPGASASQPAEAAGSGGEPVVLRTMPANEFRERRVAVVTVPGRVVVTVIEVLSPTNKRTAGRGRPNYLRKRRAVLRSPTHLVEIDLLRAGLQTFPRPRGRPCEYAVHVSPAPMRPKGKIWPIRLFDRLPVVEVPLQAGDPDVPLDLQAVFAESYDRGSFDGLADYARPPVTPLPPDLAAWADQLLREKGLR